MSTTILTVTANVALDRTYVIDHLQVGAVHRVSRSYAHTGGKGVNVSRTLASLGAQTLTTGLIGADGLPAATAELASAGLESRLFPVAGASRQTVTVTAQDGSTTAFYEAGPTITAQEWADFEAHVDSLLREAGMVVISGSLPPGAPERSLERLCAAANGHGVPVIVDAGGAAMRTAQNQAPSVAKLNRDELAQTTGRELAGDADVIEAATALSEMGARRVVVTLGAEGAVGIDQHHVWRVTHPPASGNPIGAGDAFSAALALAMLDGKPFEAALTEGAAAALASLRAPTAGALDPTDMRAALPTVQTHQIRTALPR